MRSTPTILVAVLCCLAPVIAPAETPLDRGKALAMLGAGSRWAEIEGKLLDDGTFLANDVEIIAAADKDNMEEMEITGVASAIDQKLRSMKLVGYTVSWNDQTQFFDAMKRSVQSSALGDGKDVRVKGQLKADGSFAARKLYLRQPTVKDGEVKHKHELIGPVTVIDAAKGTLRVMKTMVNLKPDCEFVALPVEEERESAVRP